MLFVGANNINNSCFYIFLNVCSLFWGGVHRTQFDFMMTRNIITEILHAVLLVVVGFCLYFIFLFYVVAFAQGQSNDFFLTMFFHNYFIISSKSLLIYIALKCVYGRVGGNRHLIILSKTGSRSSSLDNVLLSLQAWSGGGDCRKPCNC